MNKNFLFVLLTVSLLVACGTNQSSPNDFNIVPSTCTLKTNSMIPLSVQGSGQIENIEWTTTGGQVTKLGDKGEIATYYSPSEPGIHQIVATIHYVGGYVNIKQIFCEVVSSDVILTDTAIATQVFEGNITTQTHVIAPAVNLFSGPGNNFPFTLNTNFYQGTQLTIIAKNDANDWFLVMAPGNVIGWVYRDWIKLDGIDISRIPVSSFVTMTPTIQFSNFNFTPTQDEWQAGEGGSAIQTIAVTIKPPSPTPVPPTQEPPTPEPPTSTP